ncbi:hypothetical protein ABIE39_002917 [Cellulosimicrobium sp. 4261]
MVLTVLLPTTSPRPTVDASAARLQPWRAGHPRPHPSAPAPRSLTLCVDPRRPPRPRSPTIPDDPRRSGTREATDRPSTASGRLASATSSHPTSAVPGRARARPRRRAAVGLPRAFERSSERRRRAGCAVLAPPAHCPHVSPLRCSQLWISPSASDRLRASLLRTALVHSMWVELSTVIHRVPVGIHIRRMRAPAVDHRGLPGATNPDKIMVFPPKPVDGPARTHPVDGITTPGLCTVLWTAVDEGALRVDGAPSIGGRRVGTDRPPTGAATFPHWTHRFVHTHFCPLTCADTGFPRDPQPL